MGNLSRLFLAPIIRIVGVAFRGVPFELQSGMFGISTKRTSHSRVQRQEKNNGQERQRFEKGKEVCEEDEERREEDKKVERRGR